MYVADNGNHRIVKNTIDLLNGTVVAGRHGPENQKVRAFKKKG